LNALEKEHAEISRRHQDSAAEHEKAKRTFLTTFSSITNKLSEKFRTTAFKFSKRDRERSGSGSAIWRTQRKRLEQIGRDSTELARKIEPLLNESRKAESEAKAAGRPNDRTLEEKLKGFANLEQDFREHTRDQGQIRAGP